FAGAGSTTLYGIDSALNTLVLQGSPASGNLTTLGALGFDTSDLVGFDVSGSSGIAYASLTAPGAANFSQLFTIDLSSAAATLVRSIGVNSAFNAPLRGLAAPIGAPVPERSGATLLGLGLAGAVAGLARRRLARRSR